MGLRRTAVLILPTCLVVAQEKYNLTDHCLTLNVTEFSESLCGKDRGGTSRNALDLAFSVQRLSANSVYLL